VAKFDIWSIGIIFHEIIFLDPIHLKNNRKELYELIDKDSSNLGKNENNKFNRAEFNEEAYQPIVKSI
jgi:hypothetical protein